MLIKGGNANLTVTQVLRDVVSIFIYIYTHTHTFEIILESFQHTNWTAEKYIDNVTLPQEMLTLEKS